MYQLLGNALSTTDIQTGENVLFLTVNKNQHFSASLMHFTVLLSQCMSYFII